MIDTAETAAFLHGGCALLVGTVDEEGMPHAEHGWGLDVVAVDPLTARVLVDPTDVLLAANVAEGRPVAVTAADVRTLRSVQLKGTSLGFDAPRDDDLARMHRYVEAFYLDIVETDGTPRHVLDRLTPNDVAAVLVRVVEGFDQTPGPAAGRAMGAP